ncbi:MAG: cytoplasmic protein [Gammaproteobacteria bacterium GWE2_37_16]|nr:MAG: cytoplasmic protein [Gammaproteobacteria bacterium GWE2_37_16]
MKKKNNAIARIGNNIIPTTLVSDIRKMIEEARLAVAVTANVGLTMLYWQVGKRINTEILKGKRAGYGEEIIPTLARQLVFEYGRGFEAKNLWRMMQFAECFSDKKIVVTLSRQLCWSHFLQIIAIDDQLKRDFYAEMCRIEHWSVRALRKKIAGMMFERTAIAKKPDDVIKTELAALRAEDKLTPDLVFRDPYFLDFLGLKGAFQEKDLENAILREIEAFIMELGVGFTFVERQKRMVVDGEDFYLDLLFYHRDLCRLVAIELKLERFKPDFKGQMEFYLKWLDKYERKPGEEHPIGLILCAGKSNERIELLELGKSGIRVAEYITELLPKEALEKKFHESITRARLLFDNKEDLNG